MREQDPEQIADELDREAERFERHSAEVRQQIQDAREDWERKRLDQKVPGAAPPEREDDSSTGAEEGPPPEAKREG